MNAENGINIGRLQRFFLRALFVVLVGCLVSACDKYSTSDPTPVSQELAQVRSTLTNLQEQLTKQISEIDALLNDPNSGLTDEEKANLQKLKEDLQSELNTVNDLINNVDNLIASGGTVTQEELDNIKKATEEVQEQAEKTLEETKDYVPSELESVEVTKSAILIMQPTIFTLNYTDSVTKEPSYDDNTKVRYDSVDKGEKEFIDQTLTFQLNPSTVNRNTTTIDPTISNPQAILSGIKADTTYIDKRVVSVHIDFTSASASDVSGLDGTLFNLTCNVTPANESTKSATANVEKMLLENLKIYDKNTNKAIYQYCYELKQYFREEIKNECAEGSTLNLRDVVYVQCTKNGTSNSPIYWSELYSYGLDFKFELTLSYAVDSRGVSIDADGVFHANQKVSENDQVSIIRVSIIKKGATYSENKIQAYDYGYIGVKVK